MPRRRDRSARREITLPYLLVYGTAVQVTTVVKLADVSVDAEGPTRKRFSVWAAPLPATQSPVVPSNSMSHVGDVVMGIGVGVAVALTVPCLNWSCPGWLPPVPVQLAPVPPQSDQCVPLSDGIASAPWTSMCPTCVPFVMVIPAVVEQVPFGNARDEPDGEQEL